jgi:hypothetical protein
LPELPQRLKKTYCSRPWNELHIEEDGSVTPCCVMPSNRFPMGSTLKEYIEGKPLKELKDSLLAGKQHPSCEYCWDNESTGLQSHRKIDLVPPNKINNIHIRLSNVCNFKCRMCNPSFSTTWAIENRSHGLFIEPPEKPIKDTFKDNHYVLELVKNRILAGELSHINISGGEPLLTQANYELLTFLIDNDCADKVYICYSTNLSKLDYKKIDLLDLWKHFKHVTLEVSCDGWGEAVEYSRTGFSRKDFLHSNITVSINCVVNVYSVWTLPDMEKFRQKLGINIIYAPCYLPKHTNPQTLFKEDKETLKKLYAGNKNLEQVYTNFIAKDEPPVPRTLVDYNITLDKYRNTNFFEVFPQYRKYRR